MKKIVGILLTFLLMLGLMPVAAFAEPSSAISVSNETELAAAITNIANGGTITLEADITACIEILADKTVTLDLNGHNLINESEKAPTITNNGTLTVTGRGTVDNQAATEAGHLIMPALLNDGEASLNGGIFTRSNDSGTQTSSSNDWYVIQNHGTMTIDGATVTCTATDVSNILNGWGHESQDPYSSGEATLTIESGTFSGGIHTVKQAAEDRGGGMLDIQGGTFTRATNEDADDADVLTADAAVTITGGTFAGKLIARTGGSITISDATIVSSTADELANAVIYADGNVIKLGTDITANVTIPADVDTTLNLNGYTLTSNPASTVDYKTDLDKATIVNHGTLTVTDSKTAGKVTNTATECDALFNDGTATLDGGTFTHEGSRWYAIHNHGTMTINAGVTATMGDYYDASPVMNGWSSHDPEYTSGEANLVINGGTFLNGSHTVKNGDSHATLRIKGGTFRNASTNQAADGINLIDNRSGCETYITGGNFEGILTSEEVDELSVTGGYFTENPEAFVPNGYRVKYLLGDYSYRVVSRNTDNDDDDDDDEEPSVAGSGVESQRLNGGTAEYRTLKDFAVAAGFRSSDIIEGWDIDLDGRGPWKLTFELGKEYAGETVTIYHMKKNGKIETFEVTANKDGDAKITVTSASPFMAVNGKAETSGETAKEENPNTGAADAAAIFSALAVISLIGAAAAAFKK